MILVVRLCYVVYVFYDMTITIFHWVGYWYLNWNTYEMDSILMIYYDTLYDVDLCSNDIIWLLFMWDTMHGFVGV